MTVGHTIDLEMSGADAMIEEAIASDEMDDVLEQDEFEEEVEDGPIEGDEDAEPVDDDEDLESEDEAAEDDEPVEEMPTAEEFMAKWDGNPESVPQQLRPYVDHITKTSRDGFTQWANKKSQEIHALKKELSDLRQERQAAIAKSMEVSMPAKPGPDATADQVDKYLEDMAEYKAAKRFEAMQEAGLIPSAPKPVEVNSPEAYQERARALSERPDFSEGIAERMERIAASDPRWLEAAWNNEAGLDMLCDLAVKEERAEAAQAQAKKLADDKVRRQAKSSRSSVSKPKTSGSAKKVTPTPAENFADITVGGLNTALDSLDLD